MARLNLQAVLVELQSTGDYQCEKFEKFEKLAHKGAGKEPRNYGRSLSLSDFRRNAPGHRLEKLER